MSCWRLGSRRVKARCRSLIETIGASGGYIMDASAIIQNDATLENLKAMTDATIEYGVYRSPSAPSPKPRIRPRVKPPRITEWVTTAPSHPGVCFPFEEKLKELPPICGDAELVRQVWNNIEALAYLYIWHVLLSF